MIFIPTMTAVDGTLIGGHVHTADDGTIIAVITLDSGSETFPPEEVSWIMPDDLTIENVVGSLILKHQEILKEYNLFCGRQI
jgi:hypothetical protein